MEKWKSDLVSKIMNAKELAENNKLYLRCPYCRDLTYREVEFSNDGSIFEENVHPAVMLGTFVYIPKFGTYGELCRCQNCYTTFYSCYIKELNKLKFINKDRLSLEDIYREISNGKFIRQDIYSKFLGKRLGLSNE